MRSLKVLFGVALLALAGIGASDKPFVPVTDKILLNPSLMTG